MDKNVASQKCPVFAWDTASGAAKTGDAANITAKISKDGAAAVSSNDTNPTEILSAAGIYLFDLTQAETNCDLFVLKASSTTSAVILDPVFIYPQKNLATPLSTYTNSASVGYRLRRAIGKIVNKMTYNKTTGSAVVKAEDGSTSLQNFTITTALGIDTRTPG